MQILLLLVPWLQINVAVEFKRSILCSPVSLCFRLFLQFRLQLKLSARDSAIGRVSASLESQLLFLCSLHVVIVR